ncbi:hypothetical protein BOO94_19290 [Pseudomonas sp. FSL W5-0299]|nr:hypothetical protein BOO94_19290 [Pseudomonas sp. FSL W5-0299]
MSSTNTKEWKGLSKGVNAEGTKGYHAKEGKMMTNFAGGSDKRGPLWRAGLPVARELAPVRLRSSRKTMGAECLEK